MMEYIVDLFNIAKINFLFVFDHWIINSIIVLIVFILTHIINSKNK